MTVRVSRIDSELNRAQRADATIFSDPLGREATDAMRRAFIMRRAFMLALNRGDEENDPAAIH
jgi:hypothetical protein